MNGIQDWLGDMPKEAFVAEYFHKLPYAAASRDAGYRDLCDWGAVERLACLENADVMICRRGVRYEGPRPQSAGDLQRLHDEGYTVLIRHAEHHAPMLRDLATQFARDFRAEVNVHVYATPADQHGFGWHYDAEDVFILQTEGAKEYSLRKNTVQPWPLTETMPHDLQYEREIMPMMRCLLREGDWMYIPNGYWHMGQARQRSISIAIGALSPSALDVYDFARQRLAQSVLWRQRLICAGNASPLTAEEQRERLRETFDLLARDLAEFYASDELLDAAMDRFSRRTGCD